MATEDEERRKKFAHKWQINVNNNHWIIILIDLFEDMIHCIDVRSEQTNERMGKRLFICCYQFIGVGFLLSFDNVFVFYHQFYAFNFYFCNQCTPSMHIRAHDFIDPIEIYRARRIFYGDKNRCRGSDRKPCELIWNCKWAFFDATNCLMREYFLFIVYEFVCVSQNQSAQWKFSNNTYVTILERLLTSLSPAPLLHHLRT